MSSAEEGRRLVIAQQSDTVKRAIAAANEQGQRDVLRRRSGLLLLLLLGFSAWRLMQPAAISERSEAPERTPLLRLAPISNANATGGRRLMVATEWADRGT
jgi:hypothetical protein